MSVLHLQLCEGLTSSAHHHHAGISTDFVLVALCCVWSDSIAVPNCSYVQVSKPLVTTCILGLAHSLLQKPIYNRGMQAQCARTDHRGVVQLLPQEYYPVGCVGGMASAVQDAITAGLCALPLALS